MSKRTDTGDTGGGGRTSVFARPAYRRLWAARTVSQWGDVVQFTTVALLVLHLTGSGVGVSGAVLAEVVGAFAGPLLLFRLTRRGRHARFVVGAFGLRGLVDLTLASLRSLPAALGALAAYGLGTSTGNVSFSSLIQRHVPDERRGRVFSAFDLIWHASRLISIAAGGALADAYGIRAVYYAGGSLLIVAAATGAWGVRAATTVAEPENRGGGGSPDPG